MQKHQAYATWFVAIRSGRNRCEVKVKVVKVRRIGVVGQPRLQGGV